jgi:hypothetical protein
VWMADLSSQFGWTGAIRVMSLVDDMSAARVMTCLDCGKPLTSEQAVYPFARPFHEEPLCQECTDRRWDRIPHGR